MKTSRTSKTKPQTARLPKARKTASNCFFSFDDPFGSYTGTNEDKFDKPIQDVDDL